MDTFLKCYTKILVMPTIDNKCVWFDSDGLIRPEGKTMIIKHQGDTRRIILDTDDHITFE